MNSRYRIYAAVGLAAVLLLGGGFMLLGRGQAASTTEAAAIKPLHPASKKAKRAAQAKIGVPTAVKKARQQARRTQATDGLPASVSASLSSRSVVVVVLVSPGATVDELTAAEAKAGAREAGAGFVRVSVASNDDVQALSTLVGSSASATDRLLDAPAVLVVRQPHELFVRFTGYVDAETVAQAAANAAPVQAQAGKSALADPWVVGANAVCNRLGRELADAPLPSSTAQYVPYLKNLLAITRTGITRLRGLKPPAGKAAAVASMLAHYESMLNGASAILDAAEHGNLAAIKRLEPKIRADRASGDSIAAGLGANDCAGKA